MSKFVKSFRKILEAYDSVPNSKMTHESLPAKILADWGRKSCDEIEVLAQQNAEMREAIESCIHKMRGSNCDEEQLLKDVLARIDKKENEK